VSESVDAASPEAGPRSRLPHILAAVYALAIVFASLQPFGDFLAPPGDAPFWLFSPGRVRAPRFDVLVNLLAYLPFGAFIALVPHRLSPGRRVALGAVAGFAMSFVMESLQAWIPPRDANVVDLLSNTFGALAGAAIAATIARRPKARERLSRWRRGLFLPGMLGDVGLALLALWLAAQVNPAIPLFASNRSRLRLSSSLKAAGESNAGLEASFASFTKICGSSFASDTRCARPRPHCAMLRSSSGSAEGPTATVDTVIFALTILPTSASYWSG